jgi:uncharacterized protein (DUF1697 family)
MRRYAALLRGVSPANARMDDLRRAFEAAGFGDVRTVLSSGNVLFGARPAPLRALERTFGQGITTRTWDTVARLARDQGSEGRGGRS